MTAETEFCDVIRTKVLRFSLLAMVGNVNNVSGNLKWENSQDYVQKP
jgi:hypothetical protein